VQFLEQLQQGKNVNQALQSVYSADTTGLAHSYRAYVDGLPGARVGAKKAKK
jgi:hypothetical protein